jgi:cytochrome c biogenesis protein CcmG/thiol:disulfide interchange protein DsbE
MKMKLIKILYLFLVMACIVGGCKKSKTEPTRQTKEKAEIKPAQPVVDTTPSTSDKKPAPVFTLTDLNGKNVSLTDFRGKIVILDFWATWCPPCIMEIPHFIELQDKYKDKGFAMVGISLDQAGIEVVKTFAQKYKINYPILMNDGQVHIAYGGISNIPTTFVIDPAGNIRKKYVGYIEKAVFEEDIKTLLAEIK